MTDRAKYEINAHRELRTATDQLLEKLNEQGIETNRLYELVLELYDAVDATKAPNQKPVFGYIDFDDESEKPTITAVFEVIANNELGEKLAKIVDEVNGIGAKDKIEGASDRSLSEDSGVEQKIRMALLAVAKIALPTAQDRALSTIALDTNVQHESDPRLRSVQLRVVFDPSLQPAPA